MDVSPAVVLTDTVPEGVLHSLCAHNMDQQETASSYYAGYVTTRCREFLTDGGRHTNARTYNHVLILADAIRSGKSKAEISTTPLISMSTHDAAGVLVPGHERQQLACPTETSIDLCASLLTMVDIGRPPLAFSGRRPLLWSSGPLREFLGSYFHQPKDLVPDNQQIGKIFNAVNLRRLAGIKMQWSSNMANHLRLADDEKTVFIFHHAAFLKTQKRAAQDQTLLPAGVVEETLRTLSLLFPQNDAKTKGWMSSQAGDMDPELRRCGALRAHDRRFDKFAVWHDRLVILKQVFDEARPETIPQWWRDRRDRVQWYTFWVAIWVLGLTVLFGLIQSVEGAVQIYATYNVAA
ncbi:hypothetical protein QBC34DRAFT_380997 [Podospora aff. communis PSN243]|uniref:Uncharacterized protein n=1 Tax=Podospora aff. communis PSN243 TaxID=3040156 RepID=A0AAV9GLG7_9PEZI|nr:hypothetical protein QBC34DRAFT_380997 [Podospora aff. communis PSN243]